MPCTPTGHPSFEGWNRAQPPARFPVRWPSEYRSLAESLGPESPLLRMGELHPEEGLHDPEALPDPVGDSRSRPLPFLVRKHSNRVLVLASSRCFFYCRFCFRRSESPESRGEPTIRDWERIHAWLQAHPEVEEVILSGGDPFTLPDEELGRIGGRLSEIPHLRRWRIHTRAPVVQPGRITAALVDRLEIPLPLRIVLHVNHPAEVRAPLSAAVRRLGHSGQILAQSVLLRGVNDRGSTLRELLERLADHGIRPHYLHHPDRAAGNRAFRLSIEEGRAIYEEVLSSAARELLVPRYVLDLPNGAGKCPVDALQEIGEEHRDGRRRVRYRWSRPRGWDALHPDDCCEWWDIWQRKDGREDRLAGVWSAY